MTVHKILDTLLAEPVANPFERSLAGTASRRNLAQLGHKNLIFACFKCSFVDFFLLKYELTQAQVIKLFY